MAEQERRGGLRSNRANQNRIQEAQRVEDAGMRQYESDAAAARAEAGRGPSPNMNPRSAAATQATMDRRASRAEDRLAGAREAAGSDLASQPAAQRDVPPMPAASPASRSAPRPSPRPARRAAPVTSEADKLNEISLALARGSMGPQQPGSAGDNIDRTMRGSMGFAKGGYVKQTPGWGFNGGKASGTNSNRYAKRKDC